MDQTLEIGEAPSRHGVGAAVRPIVAAVAAVLAFACSDGESHSRDIAQQVQLGFDLSHLTSQCHTFRAPGVDGPRREAGVSARDNVVLNYGSPQVAAKTRSILEAMQAGGARLVRTTLWFDHSEDRPFAQLPDKIGIATASHGRLPEPEVANLVSLAGDARHAGYRTFAVAIGPLGRANPKCRSKVFADCYRRDLDENSWGVVDQVAARLLPLSSAGFQVILDVAPEDCASRIGGPQLQEAERHYTAYMVQNFIQKYGSRSFYASCGGVPEARAKEGLSTILDTYRQLKARPAIIDLHLYADGEAVAEGSLKDAEAAAESLHVPLYILETFQDDQPVFDAISRLHRAGKLSALGALSVWPLKVSQGCQIGLAPPFDLTAARAAVV